MKKQLFQLSILIFAIILSGCGDLSRNKAKSIIFEKINSDKYRKNIVLKYHISTFNGKIRIETDEDLKNAKLLENNGYIKIEYGSDKYSYNHISLLPKIQPFVYIDGGITSTVWIKIAELEDVVITGISGENNYRRVEYTFYYKLNEVGRAISYSNKLTFSEYNRLEKYDDGWR